MKKPAWKPTTDETARSAKQLRTIENTLLAARIECPRCHFRGFTTIYNTRGTTHRTKCKCGCTGEFIR